MEKEDERKTVTEFGVLCLVMPDFHAEKSTETAAQEGNGEEAGFCDTPFVMPCLPFINAVEEEGDDVDCHEIEQNGKDYFLICTFIHFRIYGSLGQLARKNHAN